MKLASIVFSVAVSTFASASDMYDSWEMKEQNFSTPAMEEVIDGEGVAHNSEQYGKCLESADKVAKSAAEFICKGVEKPQRDMCESGQYKEHFDRMEKGCRATDSDRGSSVKAEGKVGGSGGSVEYKSK